jgi:hypothetical protein
LQVQGLSDDTSFLETSLSGDDVDRAASEKIHAIQFDVKGNDRPYWFQLDTGLSDGNGYGMAFWARSDQWRTVTLPVQHLQQRSGANPAPFVGDQIRGLQWAILTNAAEQPVAVDLTIDNVRLLTYSPPPPPPRLNVPTYEPPHCFPDSP